MDERLIGRNGEIWKKYCRGMTQEALAIEYKLTRPRISQIIKEVRNDIPIEERENLIKQEMDLLRDLRAEVLQLWDEKAAPMFVGKDGTPAKDPETGKLVRDHSGRLAALARADSITARLHRLAGLDAPQKLDLSLAGEEEAAKRAAGEALAKLHGGEGSE